MNTSLPDIEESVAIQSPQIQPVTSAFKSSTCQFLLRIGKLHLDKNELRQATDIFTRIIEEYPSSEERKVAQDNLLCIAQRYEKEGSLRVALDLLEHIDQIMENA
jgi:TolA-binding protein